MSEPQGQDANLRSAERRELDRLRGTYERRQSPNLTRRYLRTNPGQLYALQEREAEMAAMLRAAGRETLAGLRILDIGCGRGATLRQYVEYGADPDQLWEVELMLDFVRQARSTSPNLRVLCGTASELPFAGGSFDIVSQFLLFTSVLDAAMRHKIACEIDRILVPGGRLLWYDFAFNNPSNRDVRGIGLGEIRGLFPGFSITSRRLTLAPPLGGLSHAWARPRIVWPHGYVFCARTTFAC